MSRVYIRNDNYHTSFTADRDYEVNELIEKNGKVGVVMGEDKILAGETVTVCFDKKVELTKEVATLALAENAVVGWDVSAGVAVASADADSDFDIGIAAAASPSGTATVMVLLNFGI